ncbi:MAG: phosphate ABC transporter permease PstA [Chitinivibrionales bacterium]|nr:phosphate ABC transporter permease PstA [Chitinivibrionales bacterium]
MIEKNTGNRLLINILFKSFVIGLSLLAIVPLILILFYIFKQGIASVNWEFLTSIPKPLGEEGGGIANGIAGTFILLLLASILALPTGIMAGIFMAENNKSPLAYGVRICVEILHGIPSIVIGIIAYLWLVKPIGTFSAFSGGVALAVIMLPVIVRTAEETLKLIPTSLKEASYGLGAPYYLTVLKVILPAGMGGIITGGLLGMARIAGETAPLLFTAFGNSFMSTDLFKPISSLPLIIFNYGRSPYEEWLSLAWGGSFILVAFVFIVNLTAKGISHRWKVTF